MLDREEILNLIKQRAGAYRTRGDETVFQACPFCGNTRYNFEVNINKGVAHCWVCGEGHGLRGLMLRLGINYNGVLPTFHKAVEKQPEIEGELKFPDGLVAIDQSGEDSKAMGYLASRGITWEDVKTYEILWWKDQGRVLFPFRNSAGNLIFWTARTIYKDVRPKYMHSAVSKTDRIIMYRGPDNGKIFIVEGVFDALRLSKTGKTVVMLLGSEISDRLMDYLRASQKDVVLALDNDMANKSLAYEKTLTETLGFDKVTVVYLPEKDVAEIGLVGGEGFSGYMRSRLSR